MKKKFETYSGQEITLSLEIDEIILAGEDYQEVLIIMDADNDASITLTPKNARGLAIQLNKFAKTAEMRELGLNIPKLLKQ